ncbi:MAG TPA: AI-2E family transporter [Planctomycetota bacterium]|nr:AI-2E family transporter [Planctomycetota bacterium]
MERAARDEPWPRVKTAFAYAVGAAALVFAWAVREVFLIVLLGVLAAIVMDALARLLQKARLPRGVAVGISALVLLGAIVGTVAAIATPVMIEGKELASSLPEKMEGAKRTLERLREDYPVVGQLVPEGGGGGGGIDGATAANAAKKVASVASRTLEGAMTVFAVLFLGTFFALDPEKYVRGTARLMPVGSFEQRVELLERIGGGLRSWLLALAAQIVVTAIVWTLGLWIIGLKFAVLFGVIAGLVEIVPYFGPLLGLILPLVTALGEGTSTSLEVVGLYTVLHIFEGYILVPLVLQKRERLPPPVVLLSIMTFGTAFGFLGVVLAVPLGTIAFICVRYALETQEEEPARLRVAA